MQIGFLYPLPEPGFICQFRVTGDNPPCILYFDDAGVTGRVRAII